MIIMRRYTFLALLLAPLLLTACMGDVQLVRPIFSCEVAGQEYGAGEGGIPASDGCNTCVCQADGSLACTEMACVPAPDDAVDETEPVVDTEPTEADVTTEVIATPETVADPEPTPAQLEEYAIMLDDLSVGSATFTTVDEKTIVQLAADLPELEAGDSYHAWLVQIEPYDAWELGLLSWDETAAQFTFEFTSFESLANYAHLVITRGDATPADPLIDIIRNL